MINPNDPLSKMTIKQYFTLTIFSGMLQKQEEGFLEQRIIDNMVSDASELAEDLINGLNRES